MHGKMQEFELTDTVPLTHTSAVWGRGLCFLILSLLRAGPHGVAAAADGWLWASCLYPVSLQGLPLGCWAAMAATSLFPKGQAFFKFTYVILLHSSLQHHHGIGSCILYEKKKEMRP